jgi:hypothetical protein
MQQSGHGVWSVLLVNCLLLIKLIPRLLWMVTLILVCREMYIAWNEKRIAARGAEIPGGNEPVQL